jgi:hypothetical protein
MGKKWTRPVAGVVMILALWAVLLVINADLRSGISLENMRLPDKASCTVNQPSTPARGFVTLESTFSCTK